MYLKLDYTLQRNFDWNELLELQFTGLYKSCDVPDLMIYIKNILDS